MKRAQSIVEFTFGIVIVVLLLLGMIKVFSWAARDLTDRRQRHEVSLIIDPGDCPACPLQQVNPYFYESTAVGFAKNSNIFGDVPVTFNVPPLP